MKNSTDTITFDLEAIDAEHDIYPTVLIVPDYNGCPIVHVFITGERVLRMSPLEDWEYEFTPATTSAERQAATSLAYHLGGITEEQEQLLANLKDNDHVVTIGGICGVVVSTAKNSVVIRVDDKNGTKIKVLRSAISRVGTPDDAAEEEAKAAK